MTLDASDKKKAVKGGIKVIGKGLENDTPKGPTGELSKFEEKVKDTGLGIEGTVNSKAWYDIFQEFGSSSQKKNVGFFERSVNKNSKKAIEEVSKIVFKNIK